ncbi:uncharacterized, partial [Tachysurus ichikawai]
MEETPALGLLHPALLSERLALRFHYGSFTNVITHLS